MRRHLNPLILILVAALAPLLTPPHAHAQPKPLKPPQVERPERPEPPDKPEQPDKPERPERKRHQTKLFGPDSDGTVHFGDDEAQPPLPPITASPFGDRIDLTKVWQFHTGSNPDYAKPGSDDHDWKYLDTSRPLLMAGYVNVNEIWYRRHVHLTPGAHDVALTIADFGGSYRVYANGQELGGHGQMKGRGDFITAASSVYTIPDNILQQPDLVIAIHAFVGTVDRATIFVSTGINKSSAIYLGPASVLYRDQQFYYDHALSESPTVIALWTLLFLLALALASLIRKVPAYPLLAIYAGGHLVSLLIMDYAIFHFIGRDSWVAIPVTLATIASELAALEFVRNVAGTPRRKDFSAVEIIYILCSASLLLANLGLISYAIYAVVDRFGYYLLLAATVVLIATGVRRYKRDAYILAGSAFLYLLYLAVWKSIQYLDFDYLWLTRLANGFETHLKPWPVGDIFIVAQFLTVVILRTLQLVRERASIATEIEAARTMQQLLLARSTDPTPGFLVETAYLPAGEVGGDFFLIITLHETEESEAGLFAIVGDVSGKGLRAAMRVSMILGVLRREPSRDPAVVLHSLNEALLSDRSDSGFTTACCVRIYASGHFTTANGGHLNPYLSTAGSIGPIRTAESGTSEELELPPALPLGLAPDQTYEPVSGTLLPGQRLILMSDGIPEARNHKGELYGFDRLPLLTLKPAAEIARTAQAFGQEDDITILTIAALTPTTNQPPPPPAIFTAPPPPPRSA